MKIGRIRIFWGLTLRIKSLLVVTVVLGVGVRPLMGGDVAKPEPEDSAPAEAGPSPSNSEPTEAGDGTSTGEETSDKDGSFQPYQGVTVDTQTGVKVVKQKVTKIDVGDKVTIKIYPEDEYLKGATMEVSAEGNIVLPLLGRIEIKGLTIAEAEKKITDLLAQDYLVNPIVVIEVAARLLEKESEEAIKRSVSILGQVQKPGTYEFPPEGKMTLLEVISKAGGFTDVANVKKIRVIRKGKGKNSVISANAESIIGGRDADVPLETDDVIHVGESFF